MAITVANTNASGLEIDRTTSGSWTWDTTPTAGNLLILGVLIRQGDGTGTETVTTPTGYTLEDAAEYTHGAIYVFYRSASGDSSDDVTVSLSASDAAIVHGIELAGADTTDPFNGETPVTTDDTDGGSDITFSNYTPAGDNKCIIAFNGCSDNVNSSSVDEDFLNFLNDNSFGPGEDISFAYATKIQTTAAQVNPTFTMGGTSVRDMQGWISAVRETVAGGANPHGPLGHPLHGPFGGPI